MNRLSIYCMVMSLVQVYKHRLAAIVGLTLIVVFSWLSGKLIWGFYDHSQPELVLPVIEQQTKPQAAANLLSEPIYLFGQAQVVSENPELIKQKAKKTRLNLNLLGVLVAPEKSVAIIEKAGKSYSFQLDEEIQQGVVLQDVQSDYVMLSHNGVLEKLEMLQEESLFSVNEQLTVLSKSRY